MPLYRAFKLDESGDIVEPARSFECPADHDAIEKVRMEFDGYAVELWDGDRRVGLTIPASAAASATRTDPVAVSLKS